MNKPIKPDITIPESFADTGVKTDFDKDLLANGFDNLRPDVLAGDNLNKFIDDTYKGLNYGMAAADAINLINEGETLTVVDGKLQSGASGGGLEIGDIGFTQMAIDESKGLRRILNGQLIIQDQYVQFTNIIKESVALNPSLACTEEEWQTAVTMSTNGVCEKFVIDDEMGTIRLPKYPQYLDLTNNTSGTSAKTATVSVLGTGKALGLTTDGGNAGLATASDARLIPYSTAYNKNAGVASGSTLIAKNQTTIGVVKNASTSGLTGSVTIPATDGVTSEKIKGTYFIQVATGAETEDNIVNEIELNNPFFLGMSQYFETAPNNISWLKSEGQWNAKAVYPTVYDWALINANNGIEGFKLVTDTYTDYDYVLNTADETFRLPLLNGSEDLISERYIDLALGASDASYTAPANGYVTMDIGFTTTDYAFAGLYNDTTAVRSATGFNYNTSVVQTIVVSRGDKFKIFYNNCTVKNIIMYRFIYAQGNGSLYFYVGETVQNANLINAGRIEEIKANKTDVDGQWVSDWLQIKLSTTAGTYNFDLSDYLPQNGYAYEIICRAVNDNEVSGTNAYVNVTTDMLPSGYYALMVGCDNNFGGIAVSGTATLPVKKTITVNISSAITSGSVEFFAYRRLGTNV